MTRFAIALIALMACSSVFAGELTHKATYTADSLRKQRISTVDGLVESYASQQHLALTPKSLPLFLINGKHDQLSTDAMNDALSKAKTVEVMSDGDAVVVNVLI